MATRRGTTKTQAVGQVLRLARNRSQLDQKQLAELCGWSQAKISLIENGAPVGYDDLIELGRHLGLTMSQLFRAAEALEQSHGFVGRLLETGIRVVESIEEGSPSLAEDGASRR